MGRCSRGTDDPIRPDERHDRRRALKAGRGLKRDFGEVENLQVSDQGAGRLRYPGRHARPKRPSSRNCRRRVLATGSSWRKPGAVEGADKSHTWYVDPLDGTTNFLHSVPIFAISIALEREGQMVGGRRLQSGNGRHVRRRARPGRLSQQPPAGACRRGATSPDALIGCGVPHLGKMRWRHPRFHDRTRRRDGARCRTSVVSAPRRSTSATWPPAATTPIWERDLQTWDMAAGPSGRARGRRLRQRCRWAARAMMAKGSVCCGNESNPVATCSALLRAGVTFAVLRELGSTSRPLRSSPGSRPREGT